MEQASGTYIGTLRFYINPPSAPNKTRWQGGEGKPKLYNSGSSLCSAWFKARELCLSFLHSKWMSSSAKPLATLEPRNPSRWSVRSELVCFCGFNASVFSNELSLSWSNIQHTLTSKLYALFCTQSIWICFYIQLESGSVVQMVEIHIFYSGDPWC